MGCSGSSEEGRAERPGEGARAWALRRVLVPPIYFSSYCTNLMNIRDVNIND